MKDHGGGAIVNIASLNAQVPMYSGIAYSSAKAGVEMLTKNAAYMERIPMSCAAEPSELAGPALFLVSEDATYVNGTSLLLDGAWATSSYPDLSKFF